MKHSTVLLFVPALMILLHGNLYSQDTRWTRTYGASTSDAALSIDLTEDGGYIATGFTGGYGFGGNVYLFKTDAFGNQLWSHAFGTSLNDVGSAVQEIQDGGFIIAGRKEVASQIFDAYLIRTDASGNILWSNTYDLGDDNRAHSVGETSDGGFILSGQAWLGDDIFGSYDMYVIKTDSLGEVVWEQTYAQEASGNDVSLSVQQTSDGGYIIGGFTQSTGWDAILIKTDSLGNTLWSHAYNRGGADECYDVRQTSDGGYILTGASVSGGGDADVLLVKTDSLGNPLWTRVYGGPSDDNGESVRETRDGGYIITGSTGVESWDLYVIKTDAQGNSIWTRTFGGSSDDRGWSVEQAWDGGFIVAGWTYSYGAGQGDAWLIKISDPLEPPLVSVDLIPDIAPVVVPRGGTFGYTGTLTNNIDQSQTIDVWVMANLFGQNPVGPLRQFNDVAMGPNGILEGHLTQRAPNLAPLGVHSFVAYTGIFPSVVMDSSFFEVEIIDNVIRQDGGFERD